MSEPEAINYGPEEITLPESGETVTVRGLTGMEVALISKRNSQLADDPDAAAGVAIQIGFMLGKRRVRDAENAGIAWLNSHGARDFTRMANAIEVKSGYGKGAEKSGLSGTDDDG